MRRGLLVILAVLFTLSAVVVGRALTLAPHEINASPPAHVTSAASTPRSAFDNEAPLDEAALAARLGAVIQHRTIAAPVGAPFDPGPYRAFHAQLPQFFPKTFQAMKLEMIADLSILLTWPGTDPALKPLVFLSHQDVVPISPGTEQDWTQPPFSGVVVDGFIWGRGTLDDKSGVMGLLESAERLLAAGFRPKRTVFFAFGHDEEVGGRAGAAKIAALLEARGVDAEMVLDEGGVFADGLFDGVARPIAMIGVAEKGYVSVELTVAVSGGHSSAPPTTTAIGKMARALARLDEHQLPARLDGAVEGTLATLAPHMDSFGKRVVMGNLWLFKPLVLSMMGGADTPRASIRTTMAPTIFQSGDKDNVLPGRARAVVNFRTLPGDTAADVQKHVEKAVADPDVKVAILPGGNEASAISDSKSEAFATLARTVRQVRPDVLTAPYLTIGGTDAAHYGKISRRVFRLLPVRFTADDLARFHGTNERIGVKDYVGMVRFYEQLLRNAAG